MKNPYGFFGGFFLASAIVTGQNIAPSAVITAVGKAITSNTIIDAHMDLNVKISTAKPEIGSFQ